MQVEPDGSFVGEEQARAGRVASCYVLTLSERRSASVHPKDQALQQAGKAGARARAESYQEKLEWARKHLDALDRDVSTFVTSDAYAILRDFNSETGKGVCHFSVKKAIPLDWSLRVGDIVHNMRSGLDALVYALALEHSGEPTNEDAINIQFLICDTEAEFRKREARRHGRMSPAAQDGITFVQPYKRPRAGYRNELAVLRDLSNIDKHRHLLPSFIAANRGRITIRHPDAPIAIRLPIRGRLVDRAVLGTFALHPGMDELDVEYESNLTLDISFEEPAAGNHGIVSTLRLVDIYIQEVVLAEMEQYFR
jgi:hypothetical protein